MSKLIASRYFPEPVDPHAFDTSPPPRKPAPIGILLINLGTPDDPTAPAIRRYLLEFLSDPRVIEIPQLLWQPLLRTVVLARRPAKLAPRYESIWLPEGSPLVVWSQAQVDGVQQRLDAMGIPAHVVLGMRYGNPSIKSAMDALQQAGCERTLVVPLYPQYAASTTATAIDKVNAYAARRRNQPELRFIKRYHDDPGYLGALEQSVRRFWAQRGVPDYLLLSFHSLPRITVELGDPYYRDCMETARLLGQRLGEDGHRVRVTFQSRFGAQKWLEPFTEPTLREWARQGVGRVDVMCPGFLADCLETLEEIQVECRDAFLAEGGKELNYIPCLNGDEQWVDALTQLVLRNLGGWHDISSEHLAQCGADQTGPLPEAATLESRD